MPVMKWNIYFTIKGPGGIVEAPNNTNPVESKDLASLLLVLADNLPGGGLVETVGLRIVADEGG